MTMVTGNARPLQLAGLYNCLLANCPLATTYRKVLRTQADRINLKGTPDSNTTDRFRALYRLTPARAFGNTKHPRFDQVLDYPATRRCKAKRDRVVVELAGGH